MTTCSGASLRQQRTDLRDDLERGVGGTCRRRADSPARGTARHLRRRAHQHRSQDRMPPSSRSSRHCGGPGVLERVCIGSFSDERLERVDEAHGDAVCLSFSPQEIARLRMTESHGTACAAPSLDPIRPARSASRRERPFRGSDRVHPATSGTGPARNPPAGRLCAPERSWLCTCGPSTIPAEMDRLLDIDVDGIMTDEPTVLLDVMAEAGRLARRRRGRHMSTSIIDAGTDRRADGNRRGSTRTAATRKMTAGYSGRLDTPLRRRDAAGDPTRRHRTRPLPS